MMDVMANHGTKIRRYMEKFGQDKVEAFIDSVLSLENLLDTNVLFASVLLTVIPRYSANLSSPKTGYISVRRLHFHHVCA